MKSASPRPTPIGYVSFVELKARLRRVFADALRVAVVSAGSLLFACSSDANHPPLEQSVSKSSTSGSVVGSSPQEGESCDTEGTTVECGTVQEQVGNDLVCLRGLRSCTSGVWGACVGSRQVQIYAPRQGIGRTLLALSSSASCGNLCDPQCSTFLDTAAGVTPPAGLTADPSGVSILPTGSLGGGNCSDISIVSSSTSTPLNTIVVGFASGSGTTAPAATNPNPASIKFSATCGSNGPSIQPTWTLDNEDAAIASISSAGVFTAYYAVAKDIVVTARSAVGTKTVTVHLVVNVTSTTGSCATANSNFTGLTTGVNEPGSILYPYAVANRPVVFPLSLTAPLVQWNTGGTTASCVKVSLRYPSGATSTPAFLWSQLTAGADPTGGNIDSTQPAFTIDQNAWNAFSTTAKNSDADIVVQRSNSTKQVLNPMVAKVHFAKDALRGTVYFTQYQSTFPAQSGVTDQTYSFVAGSYPSTNAATGKLNTSSPPTCPVGNATHVTTSGGSTVAAINLGIPGSPRVDAFSSYNTAGTGCPVCHSVSPNGKTLVTTGNLWQKWGGGGGNDVGINQIKSDGTLLPIADPPQYSFPWDSTTWAQAAGSSYTNFPAYDGSNQPVEDSRGWPYSAISPDGRYILQAPNSWGNTADNISTNNAQDGSYASTSLATSYPSTPPKSGKKRFFIHDTSQYKPVASWDSSSPTTSFDGSVDYATAAALPNAYTGSATTLTSGTNGLTVTCANCSSSSVTLAVGNTLLVKNETGTNAKYNGIYKVVKTNPWTLTRTTGTDATGELAYGQRYRVDSAKSLGNNTGSSSAPFPVYYQIISPDPIAIGTSDINFALWTTVRSVATAVLPYSPSSAANTLTATANSSLTSAFGSGDALATGMRILVKNQTVSPAIAAQNGIYTITSLGSFSSKWSITRASDLSASNQVTPNMRVQVNDGDNGGDIYQLTTTGTITLNTTALNFSVLTAGDSLLKSTTMMVPQFSPDGTKLIYVNGDADTISGASTGWRRGLSMMDVNLSTLSFSNKRRLVNNYNATTVGSTIKWPFFEHDSRSVIYVQSDPNEFCSHDSNYASVDTDLERACYQGTYGNMSPTTRGYWYGKLHSLDSSSPGTTDTELAYLNSNNGALSTGDANKAYQPTVLPFAAGGYRWVIFTSQRSYGNQFNVLGTHFSCTAALLWMAALDDSTAAIKDRSYPAFLVPGQQIAKITTTHYVNERGYIVPSQCKALGATCSVNEECCGASDPAPNTAACRIDIPITSPVTRHCVIPPTCSTQGGSCEVDTDCCGASGGATCIGGVCSAPPTYSAATFTRDYVASCTDAGDGYTVLWGSFLWHATTPSDTKISISAQSDDASTSTDSGWASGTSVSLATVPTTTYPANPPPAAANSVDVGQALLSAGIFNGRHLRITVAFTPSTDASTTPVLNDWEQRYACVASQ
jgi:hypothetical protein